MTGPTEAAGLLPVLVVEDDPQNLELIADRLAAAGYAAVLVDTGAQAIAELAARPYRAVLLDLRLPDMDGLDVLAHARDRQADLPVVVMTAHGSEAVARKAWAAGATAYLVKPIARRDLLDRLRAAIGEPPRD